MNHPSPSTRSTHIGAYDDAHATLRQVAELPPPSGLEDRVHQRIAGELADARVQQRSGFWALFSPARRLQFAGAALLMLAAAGTTWTLSHNTHPAANTGANQPQAAPVVNQASPGGGFGVADKGGKPPTLKPIKVPPVPKKKPSASRVAPHAARGNAAATAAAKPSAEQ